MRRIPAFICLAFLSAFWTGNGLANIDGGEPDADRPNILWIVSEDNGQFLGCYGDENAKTPNLDKLAEDGIVYTNSFANAPVCAVARSSWIFGIPAVTLGTHHMRSQYQVPRKEFTTYPEVIREEGYYATNRHKTDYNTASIKKNRIWDVSGQKAHYKNRPDGVPFFAIFNLTQSHESGIFSGNQTNPRLAAEDIEVPPYQSPTPETVMDWRRYYDRLELMDKEVGKIIEELERSGERENTIIAYCSDHGGVTLRSKRFLHDTGTRVPLIVNFPEKWQHLAPEPPGTVSDRLVQFIDMPKTWISLTGGTPPPQMNGRIFLGEDIEPAPEVVFLFSSRFDEAPDTSRAITDGRWKYIRNFESDRVRFQMLGYPLRHAGQVSQYEAFAAGKTTPAQSAHYQPQPSEELYDTASDPHEINNLATTETEQLQLMRELLDKQIIETRDLGFMPEPLMEKIDRTRGQTVYEFGQSDENYPIEELLALAKLASEKNPVNLPAFTQALQDENECIRYWGAVGLRALGEDARPAQSEIVAALDDPSPSVRITAAVSLGQIGKRDQALDFLVGEAENAEGPIHSMWALDGLKLLDGGGAIVNRPKSSLAKGKYAEDIYDALSAGGSATRKPQS
ncbi:MAG: sulfatase-like hydrolase/transferase [Verrucomicrobiota bacterium]